MILSNTFKSHVFRQLIATVVSGWLSTAAGFAFGFSAVLLPELKEDENFPYTDELASWIASITPLSMVIGCVCAGPLIDKLGRKIGHIILALLSIISWLIIPFATDATLFLIGRFIAGLSVGSNRPVSLVYLGEITDPKYRSLTLVCPSLSICIGVLISHFIGGYVSWKTSCFIYTLFNVSCLIFLLFLQESPMWLISKGKIDEGIKSFKWFRGTGTNSENELKKVLQRQSEKKNRYLLKDALSVGFIKPLCTSILLGVATQFNGVNSIGFYAKDILGNTIKDGIDPFWLMIIFDILRVLTIIIIFCFNKFLPRKILFLTTNFCCCLALFVLAAILFYINASEYEWLSIILISLYVIFGTGIVTLAWSFVPEMFSANLRGLGSGIAASISYLLLFVCVKVSPNFIANYGVAAMYACSAVITLVNALILCFLLPETNGRTLQDIEDSYKKNNNKLSSL